MVRIMTVQPIISQDQPFFFLLMLLRKNMSLVQDTGALQFLHVQICSKPPSGMIHGSWLSQKIKNRSIQALMVWLKSGKHRECVFYSDTFIPTTPGIAHSVPPRWWNHMTQADTKQNRSPHPAERKNNGGDPNRLNLNRLLCSCIVPPETGRCG